MKAPPCHFLMGCHTCARVPKQMLVVQKHNSLYHRNLRSIISKMRHRNPNVSLCGNTSDYLWDGVDVRNVVQLKDKHHKAVAALPKDSV